MPIKIEQGSTITLTDGIKIANDSTACYVGETIYFARGYDFPNTNEMTDEDTFYGGVVDTVVVDKFSLGGDGYNNGYKIPFSGYYCFVATVNLFECPFAEHYSAKITRYTSAGSVVREYSIGNVISPITFWADSESIVNYPLSTSAFHTDLLDANDSLVVSVSRDRTFLNKYYNQYSQANNTWEHDAGVGTKASFNFDIRVSIINPAPA